MFVDVEQSKSRARPHFSQLLETVVETSVATEISYLRRCFTVAVHVAAQNTCEN